LAGLLSDKEFKDIQHDQLKIYRKTIVKQESEIKSLIQILKPYPKVANHDLLHKTNIAEYPELLSEVVRSIDSLKKYDLINIPTRDLNSILKHLRKIKDLKIKIPKDFEPVFKKHLLGVADWIGHFETQESLDAKTDLIKLINDREQAKQLYDLMINQIYPMMIDIAFTVMTLFFCAIITIQHS
jgi:hypothetical protein